MTAEAEAARKEAHAQKALARTLQEQQRLLDDEALQQETTIKDLRNELADKEVALQNAQRKLFQARTSRCHSLPTSTLSLKMLNFLASPMQAYQAHFAQLQSGQHTLRHALAAAAVWQHRCPCTQRV